MGQNFSDMPPVSNVVLGAGETRAEAAKSLEMVLRSVYRDSYRVHGRD